MIYAQLLFRDLQPWQGCSKIRYFQSSPKRSLTISISLDFLVFNNLLFSFLMILLFPFLQVQHVVQLENSKDLNNYGFSQQWVQMCATDRFWSIFLALNLICSSQGVPQILNVECLKPYIPCSYLTREDKLIQQSAIILHMGGFRATLLHDCKGCSSPLYDNRSKLLR